MHQQRAECGHVGQMQNASSEHQSETISGKAENINYFCKPERLESTKTKPHCGGLCLGFLHYSPVIVPLKKIFKDRRISSLIKKDMTHTEKSQDWLESLVLLFFFFFLSPNCHRLCLFYRAIKMHAAYQSWHNYLSKDMWRCCVVTYCESWENTFL